MSSNDSFLTTDDDERTIIRPIPGGKRSDIHAARRAKQIMSDPIDPITGAHFGQINPLEGTLSQLLALLTQLKHSQSHPSPDVLKTQIVREIRKFQGAAQAAGIDVPTVATARYVLCTALDEAILNTPWGHDSGWANRSLLSSFHQEVSGGERFFTLLKSLAQYPTKNRNLLELMFICLALGFEGQYRIIDGGKDKLARIREWLFEVLQKERASPERQLSPRWQGVTDLRNPLRRFVPSWVLCAAAAALLALIFSLYLFRLNGLSDPVFTQLLAIKPPAISSANPASAPKPDITLSVLLAEEIKQKQLDVDERVDRSIVTIHSDGLFGSASASINASIIPLLDRIGESIDEVPGHVVVNGHTDSVPIRNARYPSNWHLSQRRAEAVADLIRVSLVDPDRVTAEGRADAEPVASNRNADGRAQNRRVDIVVIR